ncbi:MAG: 5'-methylthioadenosine/S-adenosylhomocysteine nucleosidase, partial [Oscillospiraceae bacterium]|nr:5'-methylthioadenosine/S-adenosylhomocysteine nucleosidase [Oscillospiraceae bacterium]
KLAKSVCNEKQIITHAGKIISGDIFGTARAGKANLGKQHNPYAVDMETSAIGQCAWRNQIPFVSIRCISDLADDNGAMSFDEFEKIAVKRVAEIVLTMCEKA